MFEINVDYGNMELLCNCNLLQSKDVVYQNDEGEKMICC